MLLVMQWTVIVLLMIMAKISTKEYEKYRAGFPQLHAFIFAAQCL